MNILDIKNKKGDCIFANHIYDDNTRSYMTTISIFDIVELLEVSKLICDPAYQRDFVATLSWQSDFVMSLLEGGSDTPQTPTMIALWKSPDGNIYIVDGQQRCMTLQNFIRFGNVKLPANKGKGTSINGVEVDSGATYKDIENHDDSEEILQYFRRYRVRVELFDESHTPRDIANHFVRWNNTTTLADMEQLNAIKGYGCEQLRLLSRLTLGYDNENNHKENDEVDPFFETISHTSKNFAHQLFMSKFFVYEKLDQEKKTNEHGIYTKTVDVDNLRKLYNSKFFQCWTKDGKTYDAVKKKDIDKIIKGVKKRLTFITKIIKTTKKKNKTKNGGFVLSLYRLTYWLEDWFMKKENYKIVDWQLFSHAVDKTFERLMCNKKAIAELKKENPNANTNGVKSRFAEIIAKHTPNDIRDQKDMFWKEFQNCRFSCYDNKYGQCEQYDFNINFRDMGIILKDPTRAFTEQVKENQLSKQDFKCAESKVDIDMSDSDADHIIPHDKGILDGGVTLSENCQVLLRKINNEKSNKMAA